MSKEPTVLTIEEAAAQIGISTAAVERLLNDGVLAQVPSPSGKVLLATSEVDAFALSRARMQAGLNAAAAEAQDTGLFTRQPKR